MFSHKICCHENIKLLDRMTPMKFQNKDCINQVQAVEMYGAAHTDLTKSETI